MLDRNANMLLAATVAFSESNLSKINPKYEKLTIHQKREKPIPRGCTRYYFNSTGYPYTSFNDAVICTHREHDTPIVSFDAISEHRAIIKYAKSLK